MFSKNTNEFVSFVCYTSEMKCLYIHIIKQVRQYINDNV
jgi:hypothetical protein